MHISRIVYDPHPAPAMGPSPHAPLLPALLLATLLALLALAMSCDGDNSAPLAAYSVG